MICSGLKTWLEHCRSCSEDFHLYPKLWGRLAALAALAALARPRLNGLIPFDRTIKTSNRSNARSPKAIIAATLWWQIELRAFSTRAARLRKFSTKLPLWTLEEKVLFRSDLWDRFWGQDKDDPTSDCEMRPAQDFFLLSGECSEQLGIKLWKDIPFSNQVSRFCT